MIEEESDNSYSGMGLTLYYIRYYSLSYLNN
jgi:hypothetical protein